jgi:hypothetical protein
MNRFKTIDLVCSYCGKSYQGRPHTQHKPDKACSDNCRTALYRANVRRLRADNGLPPQCHSTEGQRFPAALWAASELALRDWLDRRLADLTKQYPYRNWTERTLFLWEESTPLNWRVEWCETRLLEARERRNTSAPINHPEPVPGYGAKSPTEWNFYA